MHYSCFNQNSGQYEYFVDDKQLPINGDLPVPKLPAPAGKVGVPAIHAGRPLPAGAKRAGSGWNARGIIVQCSRSNGFLAGIGLGEAPSLVGGVVVTGVVALGIWYAFSIVGGDQRPPRWSATRRRT